MKTLQETLTNQLGRKPILKTEVPGVITENLNPAFSIRPYQKEAFQYFLSYWDEDFEGKPRRNHQLLFHMATGSGKTLMMAGIMLHLYTQGYRNFLFFVNSTNIIEKTRDNFLNALSSKYLFAPHLRDGDTQFAVREAENFQSGSPSDINIVFDTVQGLHSALNTPRENGLTYDDFESGKIVLISDEAHHLNADTKRGATLFPDDPGEPASWEGTVQRIFEANEQNVLLEFTATVDFSDANLAAKYEPKLLFDFNLRQFRQAGYSKDVTVLQADLPAFERALQAVLLSQYRRKIFEKHRLRIKPVLLFKSKTIAESKGFFEVFKAQMAGLTAGRIEGVAAAATEPVLKTMFAYFAANGITLENLAAELREDFTEDKLIEVNSKEESEKKQIAVNTLESSGNEYRAVFAVDKLNEGWDVLNLFDIVRLYDTRDSKAGKIGKTTMSEAQLIGRGARYCPFKTQADQPADQRKYDQDLLNEMRVCEELYYHSAHNPKYIHELNMALREIGIKPSELRDRFLTLKPSFKETPLYQTGLIFLNEQQKFDRSGSLGLDQSLIGRLYKVQMHTGRSQTTGAFQEQDTETEQPEQKSKDHALASFGPAVLRKAMQRLEFYEFDRLSRLFPSLNSVSEFIASPCYLGKIKVEITGRASQVETLTAENKLRAATEVLEQIAAGTAADTMEYEGTKEFKPYLLREKITDKAMSFASDDGGDNQSGRSMNSPIETDAPLHLDLTQRDWYAFNDCFGTSEEKLLIKYIDKHYDALKQQYSDVYLIRNEKHFKVYNFEDGKPLEPDFILYLIGKKTEATLHYQVFVEPKGGHLLKQDEWKEKFLVSLRDEARVQQLWADREYVIWGLPFFNSQDRMHEFNAGFEHFLPTPAPL